MFLQNKKKVLAVFAIVLLVVIPTAYVNRAKVRSFLRPVAKVASLPEVTVPTIIDGELVLPKVATAGGDLKSQNKKPAIGVVSANLIGVFNQQKDASGSPKLTGIRILGEAVNLSANRVAEISPLVKFLDSSGKTVAQKIGRLSAGFDFMGFLPEEKTFYDVTIDDPPLADRLEVSLNPGDQTGGVVKDKLKIASLSAETKLADLTPESSQSAGQKAAYYIVSGTAQNTLSDDVTGITVYGWIRDKEGKVFGFSRQDFKNDLLPHGETIDFKMVVLPVRLGSSMDSYEVGAWGKRYRSGL